MPVCEHCDTCGGAETIKGQMLMPIGGRVQGIDWCIGHIVAALNAANVQTVASCCGHEMMPGMIKLRDGRTLLIMSQAFDDTNDLMRQALSIQPAGSRE